MKKILFAALLFTATTFAFAQTKTASAYNATESTRMMQEDLMLNEGQYVQIKALNSIKQDRYRDIDQMYRNDPQMHQQRMAALNAEMDMEYQKVLTQDQYNSYLQMEGRPVSASMDNMNSSDQMNMGNTNTGNTNVTVPVQSNGSMKVKTSDSKVKAEPGKMKAETPAGEVKSKSNSSGTETKNKVKTADGHKITEEKDGDKYKYQDSRDNSKVKAKDDKLKIEDKNSKIKVEDDKMKIKSRD